MSTRWLVRVAHRLTCSPAASAGRRTAPTHRLESALSSLSGTSGHIHPLLGCHLCPYFFGLGLCVKAGWLGPTQNGGTGVQYVVWLWDLQTQLWRWELRCSGCPRDFGKQRVKYDGLPSRQLQDLCKLPSSAMGCRSLGVRGRATQSPLPTRTGH